MESTVISAAVEGRASTGLAAQDSRRMKEYISGFQPRYMEATGQMLHYANTLRSHTVMGLLLLMMMMIIMITMMLM